MVLATAIAAVLLAALVMAILTGSRRDSRTTRCSRPAAIPIAALGQALLGDYLVPFEFVSVVLLVVMIGAAYLAKGRRRERS